MKRALILTTLLCAVVAVFMLPSDQTDPSEQISLTKKRSRSTPIVSPHAHDPEPPPLHPITPANLGISATLLPVNPADLITRAIAANNLAAIQSAALAWFQRDPSAARDWLASQATFEDLHPAISYIAAHIGEQGDIPNALAWARLLPEGTLRENSLFDIQALAIRNKHIAPEELITDGLPPERIADLLSGAAGD
jgi:hypothetical protein